MNEIQNEKAEELKGLIEKTNRKYFQPNSGRMNQLKLNTSERIQFALDYYDMMGEVSLIDVYAQTADSNPELQRTLKRFIVGNGFIKFYPSTFYPSAIYPSKWKRSPIAEKLDLNMLGKASLIREYNHQNWLEILDEEAMFEETKTKHPAYKIYLDPNGTPIKFDKEKAKSVKLAIIDQGITPARCIVEGAYPHVVDDTFNTYIKTLKNMKEGSRYGTK